MYELLKKTPEGVFFIGDDWSLCLLFIQSVADELLQSVC